MLIKKEYSPNLITGLRLILIPVAFMLILAQEFATTLILVSLMAISDAIDGFLAKHFGWRTRFGTFFDPLTDKLMLMSLFVALSLALVAPWWLTMIVVLTGVVLIAGGTWIYFKEEAAKLAPPLIGKFSTLIQFVLILLYLSKHSSYGFLQSMPVDLIEYLVAATAIISLAVYIQQYGMSRV